MSTQFRPLFIPAGVVSNATPAVSSTNYSAANMVRWSGGATATYGFSGQLAPIGGQSRYSYTFASRCKAIHQWYDLNGISHTAFLCESNLYVSITDAGLTDITPTGGLAPPTPTIVGGYGDGDYGRGVQVAAAAAFTTASPTITMSAPLFNVPAGVHVFDVTSGQELGTVASYTGTTLTLNANALAASHGASDLLNFSGYSEPRSIGADASIEKIPDAFSLSNFGAILLAMTSPDGRLLYWDPASAPGTLAQPVTPKSGSTVPYGRCFVVTSERFVQIFGSYNDGTTGTNTGGSFRRFAWCNQEDYTDWSYSNITTQAGFIDLEPSSPIICAIATRTGTLFFTSKKAYHSRYLGIPYVYSNDELADNCTPWSPQSMVTTSSMVLWFSQQGPFSYDGTSILSVQCGVRPWIDDDIDLIEAREQACAVHVEDFSEFWWFFPQGRQSNPSGYNTRAAIYNYRDGWWSQAQMARSAGITASYSQNTVMANGTVAYEHENGSIYWDCDLPWAETYDLNALGTTSAAAFQGMGTGGKLMTVKQLIPDISGTVSNVRYSLFYRTSRSIGLPEAQTTPQQVRSNGYVDFRTTGRDIRLRIDLAIPSGVLVNGVPSDGSVRPVTVGQHLIDAVLRSDR